MATITTEHLPVIELNPFGAGPRTMIVCSCGDMPAEPAVGADTLHVAHQRHRAALDLPMLATYADATYGASAIPAARGLTWTQWTTRNNRRRRPLDLFTGRPRDERFAACRKG